VIRGVGTNIVLAAALAWGQRGILTSDGHRGPIAIFPNAAIEFSIETPGATDPRWSGGSLVVNRHGVLRLVRDKNDRVLFGYEVEASASNLSGAIDIRIKPIDAKAAENFPSESLPMPVPTVAAERDFRGVHKEEVVRLEILYNPATGEKIFDVLRPYTGSTSEPNSNASTERLDKLSFRDISIAFNGEKLAPQAGALTGGVAARVYIPGHGAYYLATSVPKTSQPFQHMAYIEGNRLEFAIDGDHIQIASKDNILEQSKSGVLWIYHDPTFRPQSHPEAIALLVATSVEYALQHSY
jgi:hypothetical protein